MKLPTRIGCALGIVTLSALASAQTKKGEPPVDKTIAPVAKPSPGPALAPGVPQGKPQFRLPNEKLRMFAAAGVLKPSDSNMERPVVLNVSTPIGLQGSAVLITQWAEATDPEQGTILLSPGRLKYQRGPTPIDGWFPDKATTNLIVRVKPQPQRAHLVDCAFEQRVGAGYSVSLFQDSPGAENPRFIAAYDRAQRVSTVVREGVPTDVVLRVNAEGTPQERNSLQVVLVGCEITALRL